jgi:hypothetical protein
MSLWNNVSRLHQSKLEFLHSDFSGLYYLSRKRRVDTRTRRDQVHRRNEAFDVQMEAMTDAYLAWFSSLGDAGLANNDPPLFVFRASRILSCQGARHIW